MKKLMIAFAVAAVAVMANASNVNWGLAAGESLDGTKVDGGTAYLAYSTGTVDWTKLAALESFDATSLAACGLNNVMDTFDYSSSKISQSKSIVPGTTLPSGGTIGGGSKKFYVVVIDDGGKDLAYTADPKTANIQNSTMGASAQFTGGQFTYAKAATPGPTPTPEPTSGILLVLGMAGLALRRRRA